MVASLADSVPFYNAILLTGHSQRKAEIAKERLCIYSNRVKCHGKRSY